MPSWHAKLSASASHRWMNCPGSVQAGGGVVSAPSLYAQEGTAAHLICQLCLERGLEAEHYHLLYVAVSKVSEEYDKVLDTYEFNEGFEKDYDVFCVTDEMVEAVQTYLNVVRAECQEGSILHVEKWFKLPWLHEDLGGTNDACIESPYRKLTVFDFKYGQGVVVDVEDNPQLLYYLVGAAYEADVPEFELVVVQPRAEYAGPAVKRWDVTRERILAFAKELKTAAEATEAEDAPLVPGDWCRWCPVHARCPAQRDYVQKLAQVAFTELEPVEPANGALLSLNDVAEVLYHKKAIEEWLKDIAKFAKDTIRGGGEIPGHKLVKTQKNRSWHNEEKTVVALRKAGFLKKDITPPKILSPAQVEKVKGKLAKKELLKLVETLVVRGEGEPALALRSDKREEWETAEKAFTSKETNNG